MREITDRERTEESLELIWVLREEGHDDLAHFRANSDDADNEQLLGVLARDGLITVEGNTVLLTEAGHARARGLVRRQRLAERLFTDVFEMPDEKVLDDACKVEHILSEELTESVCTFLGHPPLCPHGKPIPRGECCKKFRIDVVPVVTRLSDFEVGASGKITFIVSTDPSRINRLNSLGIAAGSVIKYIQKTPSCILQIDETTVALDPDIAKEIFLKKI
ncbi:MAG: metal-dependent transcriptional regulator [Nitrospirae bacterium]|nr:metal-dependent transcriptional regulator [Nitrospirota bacterium]